MSFRDRLALFFVLVVLVPMVASRSSSLGSSPTTRPARPTRAWPPRGRAASTSTARATRALRRLRRRSASDVRWRRRFARPTVRRSRARLNTAAQAGGREPHRDCERRPGRSPTRATGAPSSRRRATWWARATGRFGTLQVSVQEPAIYTGPALATDGVRGGRAAHRRPGAGGGRSRASTRRRSPPTTASSMSATSATTRASFKTARLPR